MKPINPIEVKKQQLANIDDEMIQAVNELLIEKFSSGSCTILQKDVIERYFKLKNLENTQANRDELYKRKQLDFEPLYKKEGWKVSYDRPGYNESYEPSFEFLSK
jgi:hypothetical protein